MASVCSIAIANESKLGGGLDMHRGAAAPATSCILVTVSLVCVCVLVVCGVLVVREYALARNYRETRCRLKNITYYRYDIACLYCAGLKDKTKEKGASVCVPSQFPCVRITVEYFPAKEEEEEDRGVSYDAILYPDSLQATGVHSQCSFSVCQRTKVENAKAVDDYVKTWRLRQSIDFLCFYDTETQTKAIVEKFYTASDVVHSMLWPSVVIIVCSCLFLRFEMKRRSLTFCGRRQPPSLPNNISGGGGGVGQGLTRTELVKGGGREASLYRTAPSQSGGYGGPAAPVSYPAHRHHRLAGKTELERRLVYKSLPFLGVLKTEQEEAKPEVVGDGPSCSYSSSSSSRRERAKESFRNNRTTVSVDRYVPGDMI